MKTNPPPAPPFHPLPLEHATMTLRITLLVLVTGLFALIWTQDQRPHKPPISQIASVESQDTPIPISVLPHSAELRTSGVNGEASSTDKFAIPVSLRKVASKDEWKLGDAEMPRPVGLVPGEYRAVSNTGIVQDLTVTLAELQSDQSRPAKFITRDVYQSQGTTLRWYFIRVQSEIGQTFPVIVQRGTHIVRPAVAPRGKSKHIPAIAAKDHSRKLRQQASQIIVGAGQRLFRNVAKTLRDGRPKRWDSVPDQIQPAKLSSEETEATAL